MMGKTFATLIVVFWVTMMGALIRTELWPRSSLGTVSSDEVMRKVFANAEPARLSIFYRGQELGYCKVDIDPQFAEDDTNVVASTQKPTSYRVRSDIKLKLAAFRVPSSLHLRGDSHFSPRYEINRFDINTTIGDARVRIRGGEDTGKVAAEFDVGDMHERREFDFKQIQGAGLASAVGVPGLANFSFLGGGGLPSTFGTGTGAGDAAASTQPSTVVYRDYLRISGTKIRSYLIESKYGDAMWVKMWVDEQGAVLKVDTSIGLRMLDDGLSAGAMTY